MYKSFSMELAGRTLTVDVGRVAAQANGAAFMHYFCGCVCFAD
jgi:polyribonucleotide nucleotidyltransferase